MVTKISAKDFNPSRLQEELATASLPITSIGWAGFERASNRRYAPAAARRKVGESVSGGTRTEDFAEPGELRFSTSRDLSAVEQTSLDAALTAHVHTVLTAEQQRQDQDEADLDSLIAAERQTYVDNLATWDTKTTAQKLAAAKQNFQILGKVFRYILRRERGAAI